MSSYTNTLTPNMRQGLCQWYFLVVYSGLVVCGGAKGLFKKKPSKYYMHSKLICRAE